MKILFLLEGTTVPSPRYRVLQFVEHWRAAGIELEIRTAYGDRYNQISGTRWGPAYKLLTRMKRIPFALDADDFDLVFVQRPAIPQTAMPERLLAKITPNILFDFDDSVWLGPGGVTAPRRRQCFEEIVALSKHVIAGNQFLSDQAGSPQKTTIIPTVIDTDRYVPGTKTGGLVIGWMGTAGNFPFVEKVVPSLKRTLARYPDATFRMVSNATFEPLAGHPQVEQIRWTPDSEIPLLQSFDIGLMPLEDSPLTRGKCAFKMIQYMSVGTPVVVSAVGANVEVFEGSDSGHLVESFDWDDALSSLLDSESDRQQMGEAGREHVVEKYSIHAVLPKYLDIFNAVAR